MKYFPETNKSIRTHHEWLNKRETQTGDRVKMSLLNALLMDYNNIGVGDENYVNVIELAGNYRTKLRFP